MLCLHLQSSRAERKRLELLMRANDKPLSDCRILVVEDEYLIADDLRRTLSRLGAEVVGPASTLDQAFQLLAAEPVDCAVLDVNLEGEMVYTLAEQLRRDQVPIVVATGYDDTFLSNRIAAAAVLEKPCSQELLSRTVINACAKS